MDEQRRDPRVEANIPLKICEADGQTRDAVTESGNISRSGVYCKVPRYIGPMTRLQVQLLLPIRKNEKVENKKIACQGVVVRTDELHKEKCYEIAIFFNDLSAKDAEYLNEYVQAHLKQKPAGE